jgi:low temperature requirement protein LtrA
MEAFNSGLYWAKAVCIIFIVSTVVGIVCSVLVQKGSGIENYFYGFVVTAIPMFLIYFAVFQDIKKRLLKEAKKAETIVDAG